MAEYIDREKIFPNGVFYVSAENPESSLTELINRICNLPTADVVPKSEVERWRRNLEAVLEEIPETKREVAREIFEEIEKALNLSKCYGESGIYFEHDIEADIAELKKKYTEEKK